MAVAAMLFLLLLAAVYDIYEGKIANWIVIAGWLLGLGLAIYDAGIYGGICVIKRISSIILLCWPLFLLHAIGAGDIKLWTVIAAVHTYHFLFWVVVVLLLVAGLFSVVVMLRKHLFVKRVQYMLQYLMFGRGHGRYYDKERDGEEITIKLAPFTAFGYCMVLIGRWKGIC